MEKNSSKEKEYFAYPCNKVEINNTIEVEDRNKETKENNLKYYNPFMFPKDRNISAIDDLINSKENLVEFKNFILHNLDIDKIHYDLSKIEYKKSLMNNEEFINKKWYLNFQPLNNISIEQYWKYEKVTLKDILSSNINLSNNIELKKNKKYLKHIAKCILKGTPHESLIKNCYKFSANNFNNSGMHSKNSFNNMNSSFLSLNSKTIKNSKNLLNWKLKYSKNLSNFQNEKSEETESASDIKSFHLINKKSNLRLNLNQGNSDVVSNKLKKVLKDHNKKSKKRY